MSKRFQSLLFFLSLLLFISPFTVLKAQGLYTPRDVQKAFNQGTRSLDGKPGKNYWQNHARYSIKIQAMPPDRTIKGEESIYYINNSPDTLKALTTRLYLNIHKAGAPRESAAVEDYLTKGMTVDSFSVGEQTQAWDQNPRIFTIQQFRLKKPLLPHDSVQLYFKWHYPISKQSGREGMIDSSTYFLAYFYPRISVYDDYQGWDRTPFVDSKEFYSDFNDYDVKITVPENFLVWGTGTLLNPDQILNSKTLLEYQNSFKTDSILHLGTYQDVIGGKLLLPGTHTWEFVAKNIPDMTFALSNHFDWDASSVEVDTLTHRRASVQSAFNDKAADFHQMVAFGRHALNWFSRNWPGIPYPYEKSTIVQGFADMEYPMMVNDSHNPNLDFSRFVVEHEIAHTYMPFYMGINETRYGFMDEGWATTFENLIGNEDMGPEREGNLYKSFRSGYMTDLSSEEQIPIVTPGTALTGRGLGTNEYGKASLGYLALKSLLGDAEFKKCLHGYMDRWNGKHPIPWDFFYTFNDISKKNLNWFWNSWFFSHNYIDVGIKSVNKLLGNYRIELENIGGMPAPIAMVASYTDGTQISFFLSPQIWEKNLKTFVFSMKTPKTLKSLKLDMGIFVDGDLTNNTWKP